MWLDKPPSEKPLQQVPILRPKPGEKIEARLVGEPVRLFVHFYNNRTWPCTCRKCALCKNQIPRRMMAYYPAITKNHQRAILELTQIGDGQLQHQLCEASDVPRGIVTVTRPHGRKNQPCVVLWTDSKKETTAEEQNEMGRTWVQSSIMRVFGLPMRNGEATDDDWLKKLDVAITTRTRLNDAKAKQKQQQKQNDDLPGQTHLF